MTAATLQSNILGPLTPARVEAVVLVCQRQGIPILDQFTEEERAHISRVQATMSPGASWESAIRLLAGLGA
jgi:hypothetical protein